MPAAAAVLLFSAALQLSPWVLFVAATDAQFVDDAEAPLLLVQQHQTTSYLTTHIAQTPATIQVISDVITPSSENIADIGTSGPDNTGGEVWASALLLQQFMATVDGKPFVGGRRVIEFGAGTGIVSIAAARLGAKTIVATDGSQQMVALTARNARDNLTPDQMARFFPTVYLWGSEPPNSIGNFKFHTLLLADLMYERHVRRLNDDLLAGIEVACADQCDVLIAYEERLDSWTQQPGTAGGLITRKTRTRESTEQHAFFQRLVTAGFSVDTVPGPNRAKIMQDANFSMCGNMMSTVLKIAHRSSAAAEQRTAEQVDQSTADLGMTREQLLQLAELISSGAVGRRELARLKSDDSWRW